jgi:hypothetical protein
MRQFFRIYSPFRGCISSDELSIGEHTLDIYLMRSGMDTETVLDKVSIFKSVSFADVEFMHSLFTLIETIITEMNLNTRIWTKE